MKHSYKTNGTCARSIDFELEDGRVKNIKFNGGCSGNSQGVSRLAEGMDAREYIARCEGIHCGFKDTSCPDQLARALKRALADEENV